MIALSGLRTLNALREFKLKPLLFTFSAVMIYLTLPLATLSANSYPRDKYAEKTITKSSMFQ